MRGALLVVLTLLFAGCASQPKASDDEEGYDAFSDLDLDADDGNGVIRGVVVDPSITPVRGATIELQGQDMTATSSKDGAFGFGNLTVGTYFLRVNKLGYFEATQQVIVEPNVDDPPVVKVTLQPDASTLPYVIADQFVGFVSCSMGGLPICRVAAPIGAFNDHTTKTVDLDRDPLHVQSEMHWLSNQQVTDELWLWHAYGEDATGTGLAQGVFGQTQGESPLILRTNAETAEAAGEGPAFADLGAEHDLVVAVFGGSMEETRLFCDQGYCGGLGFTFEQDFTVYTHAFYRFAPSDDWVFTRDGVQRP